jgi:hypothetical protein
MKLNRYQAFATHLMGSAVVALCSAALVFLVWYPDKLPQATGVTGIFLMLLAIDVVVGPVITLIVFNPAKKALKRDLAIVLLLQVCALLYGLHAVFVARPVYWVFSVDRFELVYANDLTGAKMQKVTDPHFKSPPIFRPEYISARRPESSKERIDIALGAVAGGDDVAQLPQFYAPYADAKDGVLKRLQPLEKLNDFNKDRRADVDALVKKYAGRPGGVGYLPTRGKVKDLTVIVARDSAAVLESLDLHPW